MAVGGRMIMADAEFIVYVVDDDDSVPASLKLRAIGGTRQ
jgi:hypothetical protein